MLSNPISKCLNPIFVKDKHGRDSHLVPCGCCTACVNNRGSRLTRLIELEALTDCRVFFVTLTFRDADIPFCQLKRHVTDDYIDSLSYDSFDSCKNEKDDFIKYKDYLKHLYDIEVIKQPSPSSRFQVGTLLNDEAIYLNDPAKYISHLNSKRNIRYSPSGSFSFVDTDLFKLYFKRLRKSLLKLYGKKIRYFSVGEYGPTTYRAHFHFLLFVPGQKSFISFKHLAEKWEYGTVYIDIAKGGCSKYVAGYLNSVSVLPPFYRLDTLRCRCSHSLFLGKEYVFPSYLEKINSYFQSTSETCSPRFVINGFNARELSKLDFSLSLRIGDDKDDSVFPMDTTFRNKILPRFYKSKFLFSSRSCLNFVRIASLVRDYARVKDGIVFNYVSELTNHFILYYSDVFRDFLDFLDIDFSFFSELPNLIKFGDLSYTIFELSRLRLVHHELQLYYDRIYNFFLCSDYFCSLNISLDDYYNLYKTIEYSSLCRFYESFVDLDDVSYIPLMYDNYFQFYHDLDDFDSHLAFHEMYKNSPYFLNLRSDSINIYYKKLRRKRFNDSLGLLSGDYNPNINSKNCYNYGKCIGNA